MASFLPSHIDQAAVFALLGLWHLLNTLRNYVTKPSAFRCRTWFPVPVAGTLKFLELWVLLFIVVVFVFNQIMRARADVMLGVIQTAHLQRFQHAVFASFFLLYVVVALLSEQSRVLPLPHGALHATFALGFTVELLVFHFGHHAGDNLESFVHMLMQIILLFLSLLMYLEILWPHSFLLSTARCMVLLFKGTWFGQIGLLINMPYATPLGCKMSSDDFPVCPAGDVNHRARSIQVLIFGLQMIAIVAFTYVAYAVLILLCRTPSGRKGFYDQLQYVDLEESDQSDEGSSLAEPFFKEAIPVIHQAQKSLSRRKSSNPRTGNTKEQQVISVSSPSSLQNKAYP
eukprot:c26085_g2_i1 orf=356-1384(-)